MPTPFLGQIELFAFNFAPHKWAICNGQLMPVHQYSLLLSLLGNTYGGDGKSNFRLPDLQGRAPVGFGNPPGRPSYTLGQAAGQEAVLLTQDNLPSHNHALVASTQPGTADIPSGQMLATPTKG